MFQLFSVTTKSQGYEVTSTFKWIIDVSKCFKHLRANLFGGSKYMYLPFMSFLHIDITQAVETLPQVRQELTYST